MLPRRLAIAIALLAAPAAVRADEPRVLAAVAGDLAGTGEPMLVVAGFRDAGGRAEVPVVAQRDGGWQIIARGAWPGDEVTAVEVADVEGDARPEVIALGRAGGRARLVVFALGVGNLVAQTDIDAGDERAARVRRQPRSGRPGAIRWPRAGGAVDLLVRDALSGPAMAAVVRAWNDELERLAVRPAFGAPGE
ncbi:MAG TPA: hypothetical protein VMZ28_30180 [Kofleriaceae bacterium]|nr:hypothetical protein [Kofleriaceae bacterium]